MPAAFFESSFDEPDYEEPPQPARAVAVIIPATARAAALLNVDFFIAFTLIKNIYPLNPDIGERTTFCVLSIATIITHYL